MKRKITAVLSIILLVSLIAGCNSAPSSISLDSEIKLPVTNEITSVELESESMEIQTSEETVPEFDVINPSELPGGEEALTKFLEDFNWWYVDFDCKDSNIIYDFVSYMLCDNYSVCDFSLYSDYIREPVTKEDLLFHYEEVGVDWILSNIYNLSDEDLAELKKQSAQIELGRDDEGNWTMMVYKDGEYLASPAGHGGGYIIEFKEIRTDGIYYQVTYDTYFESELDTVISDDFEATKYALMEYKTIDGKSYWSVYKVSTTDFFEGEVVQ